MDCSCPGMVVTTDKGWDDHYWYKHPITHDRLYSLAHGLGILDIYPHHMELSREVWRDVVSNPFNMNEIDCTFDPNDPKDFDRIPDGFQVYKGWGGIGRIRRDLPSGHVKLYGPEDVKTRVTLTASPFPTADGEYPDSLLVKYVRPNKYNPEGATLFLIQGCWFYLVRGDRRAEGMPLPKDPVWTGFMIVFDSDTEYMPYHRYDNGWTLAKRVHEDMQDMLWAEPTPRAHIADE